jgi:hypothetical protein
MGQLLKLPVLIHHYLEHHNAVNGVSFAAFLHEHYSDHHNHPSANGEHEKLPFKNCDFSSLQAISFCEPPVSFQFETIKPIAVKEKTSYEIPFYSSLSFSSIWQPPKTS